MATVSPVSHECRNVLYEVPWQTYIVLREEPENYHRRMTYDRGMLEIMSPSPRHEKYARYIDLVIGVWTEELGIPCCGLGQMTCKREDLAKGLEPDQCYYVQNEARVRNTVDIDFAVDPPPDLALEVEISRSSVKKAPIYAALGVGELWRYDGRTLRIFELAAGQYQGREGSVCFPSFPVAKAEEVIRQIGEVDDTTFKRNFRRWVRETFATGAEQA
jgi:Uma2 family endonuclease